jgi:hypothetical protein
VVEADVGVLAGGLQALEAAGDHRDREADLGRWLARNRVDRAASLWVGAISRVCWTALEALWLSVGLCGTSHRADVTLATIALPVLL